MASAKKNAAPATAAVEPKPTAASREKDKEAASPVFRVDLGESLPTPPIPTATDHKK